MARKSAELSPRQRQSQMIMREKATRKKRKILLRRLTLIGGGVLCLGLCAGSVWAFKSGFVTRTANTMVNGAYHLTARAGFSLQSLYLEGRSRTSMDEIDEALGVKKGDPILQVSINEVRERLEKIESVKFAAVERALPGTLYVRIVEREPVAMWQHNGKLALVDDNGVVMNGLDIAPYKSLPLIVGDDAPKHVAELLAILASQPDLAHRFDAAMRLGDRRWDIRLKGTSGGHIDVKLPEEDPMGAWKKLAEIQEHDRVLDRAIKEIDLRLDGRMFIKLAPEQLPDKVTHARET